MDDWLKIFYYDETSPSCLRWKIKPAKNVGIGDPAGSINKVDNYYAVRYNNTPYKCHRVVWELFNGEIEEHLQVDHVDGVRTNNRILNLRLVSHRQNSQNQKKRSTNTSGVTGVLLNVQRNTCVAQWCSTSGEKCRKSFSINKYGYDLAFQLACDYRSRMIQELNAKGSDYTDRHGT